MAISPTFQRYLATNVRGCLRMIVRWRHSKLYLIEPGETGCAPWRIHCHD